VSTQHPDEPRFPHADDVGAWVLGALDEPEAARFAAELERSDALRDEVARLQPVADVLAMGAVQLDAPPEIRDRLMATVAAEAQLRRAAEGETAPAPAPRRAAPRERRWFGLRAGWAAGLAGAAAVVIAVGAVAVFGGGADSSVKTATVPVQAPVGTSGVLVVKGDQGGDMALAGLKAAGAGRTYEAWIVPKGAKAPVRSTLFQTKNGDVTVHLPHPLNSDDQVLVTNEPAGGSDSPTTKPFISATV
jgi:anti-sigma-K factor RskA